MTTTVLEVAGSACRIGQPGLGHIGSAFARLSRAASPRRLQSALGARQAATGVAAAAFPALGEEPLS